MPPIVGNLIVLLALGLVVGLAVRSLWRSHKSGGHCSGDCGSCQGCHKK
ncbi:MAG: FeoB-associated Cys-rich membrane protein [Oscillibacter sp.]|nr:FeoB-associated Cys-rich membrane protein [Oscillibacter sp.]